MEKNEKDTLEERTIKRTGITKEEYQHFIELRNARKVEVLKDDFDLYAPQKFKMSECEKDYWLYMVLISFVLLFVQEGIAYIPIIVIFFGYKIMKLRYYINHKK